MKSSALGYAVSFLLLVGLVCSAVVFINSVNKRLEINFLLKEHLVFDNIVAVNYGAKISDNRQLYLFHLNGDTSRITVKTWGAFNIVTAKTFHNSQSVHKTAMIGYSDFYSYATVYTSDNKQPLKICGETKIKGVFYGSERGLERGYIAGKNYPYDNLIEGEMKQSEKILPELHQSVKNLTLESFIHNIVKIDFPEKDSVFSFEQETSLYTTIDPVVITNKLKGNLIIHSFHSILVKKEAELKDIIVIAPEVIFESGFKGNVQVIAHEHVLLEEKVVLEYPSTIVLNEITQDKKPKGVYLDAGAMIVGGILIVSQKPDFRNPPKLKIHNATVGGLVYNVGETEVIGKIHGYTYTNKFSVKIGGGEYQNYLVDAELSSTTLPKELILPQWIKTNEQKNTHIVKWL